MNKNVKFVEMKGPTKVALNRLVVKRCIHTVQESPTKMGNSPSSLSVGNSISKQVITSPLICNKKKLRSSG